jgi:hypothetical protein
MDGNLLDEALADFDSSSSGLAEPAQAAQHDLKFPVNPPEISIARSSREGEASSSDCGKAPAFDPLGKKKKASSKPVSGASFDPLKKGKARQSASTTGNTTKAVQAGQKSTPGITGKDTEGSNASKERRTAVVPTQSGSLPTPGNSDTKVDADLARGVAQLMADLAKADMSGPSAGKDPDKGLPHEREIASTLAALAAAVPTSARGPGARSVLRMPPFHGAILQWPLPTSVM